MNLLITKTKHYFDGHGSPDTGAKLHFITDNKNYLHLKPGTYYSSDADIVNDPEFQLEWLDEAEMNRDCLYAQDGYNCRAYTYTVQEIDDNLASEIIAALKEYNRLLN